MTTREQNRRMRRRENVLGLGACIAQSVQDPSGPAPACSRLLSPSPLTTPTPRPTLLNPTGLLALPQTLPRSSDRKSVV